MKAAPMSERLVPDGRGIDDTWAVVALRVRVHVA